MRTINMFQSQINIYSMGFNKIKNIRRIKASIRKLKKLNNGIHIVAAMLYKTQPYTILTNNDKLYCAKDLCIVTPLISNKV